MGLNLPTTDVDPARCRSSVSRKPRPSRKFEPAGLHFRTRRQPLSDSWRQNRIATTKMVITRLSPLTIAKKFLALAPKTVEFMRAHHLRYPYLAGGMANGIAFCRSGRSHG